jgi:hypothetical protein
VVRVVGQRINMNVHCRPRELCSRARTTPAGVGLKVSIEFLKVLYPGNVWPISEGFIPNRKLVMNAYELNVMSW